MHCEQQRCLGLLWRLQKGQAQQPAQDIGAKERGHRRADRPGQGVVEHCGSQNAKQDGNGFAEARGQNEGQQLRLVANLGQRDDARGNQKRFHILSFSGTGGGFANPMTQSASPVPAQALGVKGLAKPVRA